ncbi:hypothetical protein [Shewanella gaetbuli]|uniref:Portal protein n=1 Tax=Shewanella gaetbuli TaxID=220752 RepID=A0A9X1ZP14_9GAMM|nr:hypothetical protein [Shewanella gaetbuli]MCL1142975.1 hypothetical protein [Shewanella gaetbuli]
MGKDKKHRELKDADSIALDNYARFADAYKGEHTSYVERAQRNDKFYAGEQWKAEDKATLEAEGRPALTLNLILSTVNAIIGEQLDRKVEPIFRATSKGHEDTAFRLNKITRCILNDNDYDDTEERVFSDGIIGGRGFFDIRLSFANNAFGEVAISLENPLEVVIDKEAKEMDPTTWNEVFISRWMTVEDIEVEYGFKAAERIRSMSEGQSYHDVENFDYFAETFGGEEAQTTDPEERGKLRRVRVIERQHYKLCEQLCYVDVVTGDVRPIPMTTSEEEAKQNAPLYNAMVAKRKMRRVRITTSVDRVLLHDDWSLYRSFTIVPFFPYFRRGRPFGVVDNLIDPQNLLNKTSSQELHIVNTTANSGWVVEEGSLTNMDEDELEERGAETGLVLVHAKGASRPEKITPNQIPTGIDRISQKASSTIREVSAVNASMLGASRADQSGLAQEKSIVRGQVQISVVLSNLRRARLNVLRKVLELVQDFYVEERYFSMTDDSIIGEDEEQQYGINVPSEDGEILYDVTLGKYSVAVDYRPADGTLYDKEFEEALRMRELGIAIPDYVLVQYSNLTKRSEIAEFLKNSQGFGELSEEEAALQQMQAEHQVRLLQKEIETIDAEIQVALATAKEKMARADSLEGYNEAQMEMFKLSEARKQKEQELSLRIALAARSHSNQNNLTDKRIASQVAMKSMDLSFADKKTPKSETPKR